MALSDFFMNLPSTQGEARSLGVNKYFDGKTCKHGHLSARYARNRMCVECSRILKNEYRKRNIEKLREWDREYTKRNSIKGKVVKSIRRATKRNAMPSLQPITYRKDIESFYALAKWMEEITGDVFHVDHIYPLTSDFMCGLHLPQNLIVLTASDNLFKSNTWWPGQLDCQRGKGKSHQWWIEAMKNAGEKIE